MTNIETIIQVPEYIQACASAIKDDLFNGPTYSLIEGGDITKFTKDHYVPFELLSNLEENKKDGDIIEETYVGKVGDALREFINGLPAELWEDTNAGEFLTKEPEGYEDENGEYIGPIYEDYLHYSGADIVALVFGKFLAREFS